MSSIVTLDQIRSYLRISSTIADDTLSLVAEGVTEYLELATGISTSFKEDIEEYITASNRALYTKKKPLVSVHSVYDILFDFALCSSDYTANEYGIFANPYTVFYDGINRYRVIYSGGYTEDSIPTTLKLLALQLISRWFDHTQGKIIDSEVGQTLIQWEKYWNTDMAKVIETVSMNRFC